MKAIMLSAMLLLSLVTGSVTAETQGPDAVAPSAQGVTDTGAPSKGERGEGNSNSSMENGEGLQEEGRSELADSADLYSDTAPERTERAAAKAVPGTAARPALSTSERSNGSSLPLANMVLALLAVIGMILAMAWLVKRFSGLTPMNNRQIKIIATLPVGARERIVVVEIGTQQLVLGVTPQHITSLHVLEESLIAPGKPGTGDFAQRLQALLGKGDKA